MSFWKNHRIQTYYRGTFNRRNEIELAVDRPLVKSAMVGTTLYAAYQKGDEIKAMVVLSKLKYNNLAIKIIEEDDGPLYYECPVKILDCLTQTQNPRAIKWRNICRQKQTSTRMLLNKLKVGSVISFNAPSDLFSGAKKGEKIFVEKVKGTRTHWIHDGYRWEIESIPEDYVIEVDASKIELAKN